MPDPVALIFAISAVIAFLAIAHLFRRPRRRIEQLYFKYHASHELPIGETELFLVSRIEDIFFSHTRTGQLRPDMKLMNLYRLVSGPHLDDMEFERLLIDVEDKYSIKIDQKISIVKFTIRDLAKHIEMLANKSLTGST